MAISPLNKFLHRFQLCLWEIAVRAIYVILGMDILIQGQLYDSGHLFIYFL